MKPPGYKEFIIFILLCLLAIAAGAYLTYRANRFDTYYELRSAE